MSQATVTGGCQCGAVRYRIERLGRSAVCHCRMCQKATGGVFGVFVTAHEMKWTRGRPAGFASSDAGQRLFCADCGTPLAFEPVDGGMEVAVGTFDDPALAAPVIEVNTESKVPFFDTLTRLPPRPMEEVTGVEAAKAKIVSYQHPDHDTDRWPLEGKDDVSS